MCLNIIFNLYIACAKYMYTFVSTRVFIVEFKSTTAASGTIALRSKAPSFYYILNAVIFLMARVRVRIQGRPIYFYTL